MLRNRKIKRNWNAEDLTLLVWAISQRIQEKGLSHFSEMVLFFLFSRGRTGSLSHRWFRAVAGRSVNLDGWDSKKFAWSPINGRRQSHGYSQRHSFNRANLTGKQFRNYYMNETPPKTRSFAHPSSAGNIGTASSTPTSTKDPGLLRKIEGCLNMFWNLRAPRSGHRSPSSWQGELKMPSKTDLIYSWVLRRKHQEIWLKNVLSVSV